MPHPEKIGGSPGQIGLLKRSPTVSRDEFQAGWLDHAAKGLPWALDKGAQSYVQIYHVRPSAFARANPDVLAAAGLTLDELASFDGAAELVFDPPGGRRSPLLDKFYEAWVAPDETRFLPESTQKLMVWVDRRLVDGERHVLVEGGKPTFELRRETWDSFVAREGGPDWE